MIKKYFDQEAYNYIERKINETKIDSVFKPTIIDIILRRKYEYQLDDKYFHRDVDSFINNVNEIYCKNLPQEPFVGVFVPQKKCIIINLNKFDNMNNEQIAEKLLHVICHECEHAMHSDETGNDRTFPREKIIIDDAGKIVETKGIREAFTEKKTDRIIHNRIIEDASKYYSETSGYKGITEFVDAIEAAFGIKENELLSAEIKGK